jgi:signal transduction histidine kinase
VVLPAMALAFGILTAMVVLGAGPVETTYGAASPAATVADLAAGLGLLAAGIALRLERAAGSTGALAIAAGGIWLAGDWVGWDGGSPLARSLAMVAAPFLLAVLLHLALAFPTGRLAARLPVALAYGAAATYALARVTIYDPFLDPRCWSNCSDNAFLIAAHPRLAASLHSVWLWTALVLGLVLAAVALGRLAVATRGGRTALWPVLVPIAIAGVGESAYAAALLSEPVERPDAPAFLAIFLVRAAALSCLALGLVWSLIAVRRTRAAVGRLAAELGAAPAPGSLRAALARSLGDDDLEVAYWLPRQARYVDASGAPVEPRTDGDRAATTIARGAERLAVVVHDRALYGSETLERDIGSAARLAVDNERLRAQVLAQLADLRAARARIVETGDAERTRLERDLHDGAQQRLLALSYDLRVVADAQHAGLVAHAVEEVQVALAELRELADGIYPAILGSAGLGPALETFGDSSPLPLEVARVPGGRYAAPVETAVYLTVTEAASDAAVRGAGWVRVQVDERDGMLTVEVDDDVGRLTLPLHISDRVGALGGRVLEREDTGVRVEIPCA